MGRYTGTCAAPEVAGGSLDGRSPSDSSNHWTATTPAIHVRKGAAPSGTTSSIRRRTMSLVSPAGPRGGQEDEVASACIDEVEELVADLCRCAGHGDAVDDCAECRVDDTAHRASDAVTGPVAVVVDVDEDEDEPAEAVEAASGLGGERADRCGGHGVPAAASRGTASSRRRGERPVAWPRPSGRRRRSGARRIALARGTLARRPWRRSVPRG